MWKIFLNHQLKHIPHVQNFLYMCLCGWYSLFAWQSHSQDQAVLAAVDIEYLGKNWIIINILKYLTQKLNPEKQKELQFLHFQKKIIDFSRLVGSCEFMKVFCFLKTTSNIPLVSENCSSSGSILPFVQDWLSEIWLKGQLQDAPARVVHKHEVPISEVPLGGAGHMHTHFHLNSSWWKICIMIRCALFMRWGPCLLRWTVAGSLAGMLHILCALECPLERLCAGICLLFNSCCHSTHLPWPHTTQQTCGR